MDNRGALWTFVRDVPAGAASQKLPLEEARPLAENALRDYFGRQASEMDLESAASLTWKEQPAASFAWADRNDYHGLKARYRVRLFGREVAFLNRTYDLPAGYVARDIAPVWGFLPWLALNVILLIVGFSQRRPEDLYARWRVGIAAVTFVVEAWVAWRLLSPGSVYPASLLILMPGNRKKYTICSPLPPITTRTCVLIRMSCKLCFQSQWIPVLL